MALLRVTRRSNDLEAGWHRWTRRPSAVDRGKGLQSVHFRDDMSGVELSFGATKSLERRCRVRFSVDNVVMAVSRPMISAARPRDNLQTALRLRVRTFNPWGGVSVTAPGTGMLRVSMKAMLCFFAKKTVWYAGESLTPARRDFAVSQMRLVGEKKK